MKIEISLIKNLVTINEFDDNSNVKLITKGSSPQHHALMNNVVNKFNAEPNKLDCKWTSNKSKLFVISK